jgi:hypothetical protein
VELGPERDRHRVLEMRAPRLRDRGELGGLAAEARGKRLHRAPNVGEREQCRQLGGGRIGVVGRLAAVHVVVGTDDGIVAAGLAEELERAVREYLVDVHVERRTRARLEDVDHELIVVRPVGDLAGRGLDRGPQARIEHAQVDVGPDAGELHEPVGPNEMTRGPKPAHREVLAGAQRLDAPVGRRRDLPLAERVLLDAVLRHGGRSGTPDKTFRLGARLVPPPVRGRR